MAESYSIASREVQQIRVTLLDNCSSSPSAVLAVLEATMTIVDSSSVFLDYAHVKAKLVCPLVSFSTD